MSSTNQTMNGISASAPQMGLLSIRGSDHVRSRSGVAIPKVHRYLIDWFTWYSRRYIRRHFHALRVSRTGLPQPSNLPLVIYSNHASWWDPLVGLVVKSEFFEDRTLFAPMDAVMLQRYKMFARLGFFGVEQGSRAGAAQFLRTAQAVLQSPQHLLAVTPQSRFADARERPAGLHAGLGHLARRVECALFIPVAVEYVFWEERLPEILVRFGEPMEARRGQASMLTPESWTKQLEHKLEEAQDALAIESRHRDAAAFQVLLRGGAGQGGIYDWWRALKAKWRGDKFIREHGSK